MFETIELRTFIRLLTEGMKAGGLIGQCPLTPLLVEVTIGQAFDSIRPTQSGQSFYFSAWVKPGNKNDKTSLLRLCSSSIVGGLKLALMLISKLLLFISIPFPALRSHLLKVTVNRCGGELGRAARFFLFFLFSPLFPTCMLNEAVVIVGLVWFGCKLVGGVTRYNNSVNVMETAGKDDVGHDLKLPLLACLLNQLVKVELQAMVDKKLVVCDLA
ncbi:hypothetical protein T01_5998 [Trichinella spiralis]|uniref:Uncharacterized protein n=1 Tax=Trichinella spiralis TaxID=6334 RepID=A0A0V1BDL4_TRISP|nr:hypothetical protein T01_5998 [Trichinella spiralis]